MKRNKKHIMILPDGNFLAHTSRPFEIAKVLKKMGHRVTFAGEGKYLHIPRDYGFEIIPLKTVKPENIIACCLSGRVNFYDRDDVHELVEAELGLFQKIKPDMVLSDFRLTASISCEMKKIPLAVILNGIWTNYYTVPPRLTGKWKKGMPQWMVDFSEKYTLKKINEYVVAYDNKPFKEFRKKTGLSPRNNIWDTWHGDLNLIADIPEYAPTLGLPKSFSYIGPLVWEPDIPLPAWFKKLKSGRPTVYVTLGSTGDPRLFNMAVESFADTDYQVIMTTGGLAALPDLPENFFVTDYAPGSKIMAKSDVVICQGGNGTIYQGMAQGVPIIGIPQFHDQEYNLNRVTDLGLGRGLNGSNIQPRDIKDAVDAVLSQKSYREKAAAFKRLVNRYNGPATGAGLIDRF